ncbi:autotransporter outer membrane beta-barrel domain-containing protein [Collimonas humicola]|uniref:autotransporter outer membrane beta-barrel domain-containing protein n=1 Tax=Collimonas humicola TaxID=2825886 RepID=UPI001B8CF759|nr:autotransporter outer membrane beta-barrel domain-containing protein [Collimonas humicola]
MNKVFRIIWSQILGAWVPVSELTKTRGKSAASTVATVGLGAVALALCAAPLVASAQANVVIDTDQSTPYVLTSSSPTGNLAVINDGVNLSSSVNANNPSGAALVGAAGFVWDIVNRGTVTGTNSNSGMDISGIGSSITNYGSIVGRLVDGTAFFRPYGIRGDGLTINNFGNISADRVAITNGAGGAASYLNILNQQGAVIRAEDSLTNPQSSMAILVSNAPLALRNEGTVSGQDAGVFVSGGTADIVNSGLIESRSANFGIALFGQDATMTSSIVNQSGGQIVASSPTSQTGRGIYATGGTLIVNEAGASIQGSNAAIYGEQTAAIAVDNAGTIDAGATGAGIFVQNDASIVNRAGAAITGNAGVSSWFGGKLNLVNEGQVTGNHGGTAFLPANNGRGNGVYVIRGDADITNAASGQIIGQGGTNYDEGNGIFVAGNGASRSKISNAGSIQGQVGIYFDNTNADVYNAGTITGNDAAAIIFSSNNDGGTNNLTLDTGSVLNGMVYGGIGAQNNLILEGTGSEDFDKFSDFQTLAMNGQDWTLNGTGQFDTRADINSGTLHVEGTLQAPITAVNSGGTLAGYGRVIGDVNNAGIIAPGSAGAGNSTFGALTIQGNYVGNGGKLLVNTFWGDDSSGTDKLVIDGCQPAIPGGGGGPLSIAASACSNPGSVNVSGDTGVIVKHAGGSGAQTNVGIQIVETLNGATTNPDAFVLDPASDGYRSGKNTIAAGGYDYRLKRGGNGGVADDWYLVSAAAPVEPPPEPCAAGARCEPEPPPPEPCTDDTKCKPEPPPPEPCTDDTKCKPEPPPPEPCTDDTKCKPEPPPPLPVDPVISPEVGAYFGNRQAASTMAVHTLHQRQGQAPGMTAEDAAGGIDGAAWARVEGQDISRESAGGSLDIEAKQRLIHVGADVLRFKDGGDGSFRVGVMGMYGTATTWSTNRTQLWSGDTLGTARGTVDGYNVGLYGTWYGNHDILSGPYVDTWLTAGRYNNTVGGAGLATEQYRSRTLTASIEGGYSFPIYDQDKTKLYLEPQAQIVYGRYRAGDFTEVGGTAVGGQNGSNVLTRLGVRLHGSSAVGPGPDMRPYGELNWWHGSQSAPSMTMDGNVFRDNLPRDRAEVKVGLQGQVTKAIAVSALLGVETDLGNYYAVKGQVGMKYSWK